MPTTWNTVGTSRVVDGAAPGDLTFSDTDLAGAFAGQARLKRARYPWGAVVAGVLLEWPFDEGSGTTATDRTVNAYNGTISGNATWYLRDGQYLMDPSPAGAGS